MDDFKIGDRVRVLPALPGVFQPGPGSWEGRIGIVEADPGDYGVRFPGEIHLRWFLGEELEFAPVDSVVEG